MKTLYSSYDSTIRHITFENNKIIVKTTFKIAITTSTIVVDRNEDVEFSDIFHDTNRRRYYLIGYYQNWLDKVYERYPLILWHSEKNNLSGKWIKTLITPIYVIDPIGNIYNDDSQYISNTKNISFKYNHVYELFEIHAGKMLLQSNNTLTWLRF